MKHMAWLPILDTPYVRYNAGAWVIDRAIGANNRKVLIVTKHAQDAQRYAGPEVEEDDEDLRLAMMENGPWVKDSEVQRIVFEIADITAIQLIEVDDGAQITIATKGTTVSIETSDREAAIELHNQLVFRRYGVSPIVATVTVEP